MTEEVSDSWEEMFDGDDEMIDKKLNDLKIVMPKKSPQNSDSKPLSSASVELWSEPSSNNINCVRILKRPANAASNTLNVSNESSNTNQIPQITLEDNTRTQYTPTVRILKRPNNGLNNKNDAILNDNKSVASSRNQTAKTYEERRIEYNRARERILGCAAPLENDTVDTNQSKAVDISFNNASNHFNESNTALSALKSVSHNDMPILRHPKGPDGSRGFTMKR